MLSVQLNNYLQKIDKNLPINYPKFLSLIRELKLPTEIGKDSFSTRKIKGDLYQVQILSSELKDLLQKMAGLNKDSRISLATQNLSHFQKTSGSLMLVRKAKEHPFVIVFDGVVSFHKPAHYSPGTTCLIIENLENFLQIDKTLESLKNFLPSDMSSLEIVFADGMAVANSYHGNYFSKFNKILLFLDLDLGGLNIAIAIHRLIPEAVIEFIIAPNTPKVLEDVALLQSPETLKKIEALGQEHPFISDAAKLICKNRKTIEQEAFLHE